MLFLLYSYFFVFRVHHVPHIAITILLTFFYKKTYKKIIYKIIILSIIRRTPTASRTLENKKIKQGGRESLKPQGSLPEIFSHSHRAKIMQTKLTKWLNFPKFFQPLVREILCELALLLLTREFYAHARHFSFSREIMEISLQFQGFRAIKANIWRRNVVARAIKNTQPTWVFFMYKENVVIKG